MVDLVEKLRGFDSWFTWWLHQPPGKPIYFPKRDTYGGGGVRGEGRGLCENGPTGAMVGWKAGTLREMPFLSKVPPVFERRVSKGVHAFQHLLGLMK